MSLDIFQNNGKFLMLALDHRGSIKKVIGVDKTIINIKREIIEALESQFSAVLLDAEYGLPAYQERTKPYLLALEKSGYRQVNGERLTELEYSVSQIKALGASGAKLLLYFNPHARTASQQLETARKALQDCLRAGLPLFLEIVTYDGATVVDSVKAFVTANIIPDVFKLEYARSLEGCREISQIVGQTPWILLTAGKSFDVFKENLKVAIQGGAAGFLAGRALWQEFLTLQKEERSEFLNKTLPERFRIIANIALGEVIKSYG